MLCSAPQPSEATWFALSPHWPAAPRAGMASAPAAHHPRDRGDQSSSASLHREGKTILLLPGPGNPLPTSSSITAERPAVLTLSHALPWGQPRARLTALWGLCPWPCTARAARAPPCPGAASCPPWQRGTVGTQQPQGTAGTFPASHSAGGFLPRTRFKRFVSASHFFLSFI